MFESPNQTTDEEQQKLLRYEDEPMGIFFPVWFFCGALVTIGACIGFLTGIWIAFCGFKIILLGPFEKILDGFSLLILCIGCMFLVKLLICIADWFAKLARESI
ncbi:hypothetical protein CMO96_02600 [Candidatus Woesebacteria bacterium]|nr:hypothetical protein [Candidatus Woesebacteria bacterium]|tara:strand:- start:938 stop:1249 length:312 start_codon:yes stop_codon:yes gene_type:complete